MDIIYCLSHIVYLEYAFYQTQMPTSENLIFEQQLAPYIIQCRQES